MGGGLLAAVSDEPLASGLALFAGCTLCPLGNLSAFHAYLIATNVTTNEEITVPYDSNPFPLGLFRNIKQFALSSPVASLVHPRSLVPAAVAKAGWIQW